MLDIIFNIYIILVVNDLLVLDDSFSRVVFFWILFLLCDWKSLLLRVFVLFVLML